MKEEELFYRRKVSKFLLAALFANARRVQDVSLFRVESIAILFETRDQPLAFLENKRLLPLGSCLLEFLGKGYTKMGRKATERRLILLSRGGTRLGPVVQRPISANPGLKFNPRFFFFCSKTFPKIIFLFVLTYPIIKL